MRFFRSIVYAFGIWSVVLRNQYTVLSYSSNNGTATRPADNAADRHDENGTTLTTFSRTESTQRRRQIEETSSPATTTTASTTTSTTTTDNSWLETVINNLRAVWNRTTTSFLDCDDDDATTDNGAPESPNQSPTTSPRYLGCWVDAADRAMEYSGGNGYSINTCIDSCRTLAYPYAGLEFYDQCVCGHSYNKYSRVSDSECNTPCKLGEGICGGPWRMSVWTTDGIYQPSPPPPPSPISAPSPTINSAPSSPSSSSGSSNFNIALSLQGVLDSYYFEHAVARWEQVIKGDLPDIINSGNLGGSSSCGPWPEFVDDLYICGRYQAMDGPSGVLGAAGPRHYRVAEGLPITGEMRFDIDDVNRPSINLLGVILHEMGHVLGIGSLWTVNGLINSLSVPCNYNMDAAASREFRKITGCSGAIPLEQSFTTGGSNCAHWEEACLEDEIMTPRAGNSLPISRITIAALQDLGYEVFYGYADIFSSSCGCRRRLRHGNNNSTTPMTIHHSNNSTFVIGSRPLRRLSEEGLQIAKDYGKKMLADNRKATSLSPGMGDFPDIGEELIFVIYEEDGNIHNIMVTAYDED